MTAAVAGAAARGGGTRAAASSAARSSTTRSAGSTSGRRPRARTVDERGQRAAERFDARWSRPGAAEKKKAKPPSQRGLMDALAAGDQKPARGGGSDTAPATRDTRPAAPSFSFTVPGPVSSGAGAVLAVIVWAWVGLPLLTGGPAAVKAQLMAKFLNRAPDGTWLP